MDALGPLTPDSSSGDPSVSSFAPSVSSQIPAPLRLPPGSVRAILALTLCGTLWYLIFRGEATFNGEVAPPILVESALLVVAFYFGVRSSAPIVPVQEGPDKVRQPLYVPRGVVRGILAAGFLGVIGYVFYRDGAIPQALLLVFQVVVSYLVGFAVSAVILRRARAGKGFGRAAAAARNVISVAAIGITAGVCAAIVIGRPELIPSYFENGLAWTIAFYFGSRLAPS